MSNVPLHVRCAMTFVSLRQTGYRWFTVVLTRTVISVCCLGLCLGLFGTAPTMAGVSDDQFDGNIFVLYASNGSLVPPKTNLSESLQKHRPSVLMFYTDDSAECKDNALVISQLQAFYRQNVSFIPISVDTLSTGKSYTPQEAPYYYNGTLVPQFLVVNPDGDVVLDTIGQTPYELIDDALRDIYELPPRPESFSIARPAFSPSPSADTTFWTAPVRGIEGIDTSNLPAPATRSYGDSLD